MLQNLMFVSQSAEKLIMRYNFLTYSALEAESKLK